MVDAAVVADVRSDVLLGVGGPVDVYGLGGSGGLVLAVAGVDMTAVNFAIVSDLLSCDMSKGSASVVSVGDVGSGHMC